MNIKMLRMDADKPKNDLVERLEDLAIAAENKPVKRMAIFIARSSLNSSVFKRLNLLPARYCSKSGRWMG